MIGQKRQYRARATLSLPQEAFLGLARHQSVRWKKVVCEGRLRPRHRSRQDLGERKESQPYTQHKYTALIFTVLEVALGLACKSEEEDCRRGNYRMTNIQWRSKITRLCHTEHLGFFDVNTLLEFPYMHCKIDKRTPPIERKLSQPSHRYPSATKQSTTPAPTRRLITHRPDEVIQSSSTQGPVFSHARKGWRI